MCWHIWVTLSCRRRDFRQWESASLALGTSWLCPTSCPRMSEAKLLKIKMRHLGNGFAFSITCGCTPSLYQLSGKCNEGCANLSCLPATLYVFSESWHSVSKLQLQSPVGRRALIRAGLLLYSEKKKRRKKEVLGVQMNQVQRQSKYNLELHLEKLNMRNI